MRNVFCIQDTMVNKITYYHLIVFVMVLPLDRLFSELLLISLLLHTCIHLSKNKLLGIPWRMVILLMFIYILTIIGTSYTNFYGVAFFEWERQLAFLLFPLIFSLSGIDLKKYILNIVLAMAIGCVLAIIYLYILAFTTIIQLNLPVSAIFGAGFINHNFSAEIDMHATYFSMYIALSAAGVGYYLTTNPRRTEKIVGICILVLLLAALIQLSSRAVFIAAAIIANVLFPMMVFNKKKRVWYLLGAVACSVVVFGIITQADTLKQRVIAGLKEDLTQNNFEPRVQRWKVAWDLIKQSPVYGHGSGSEVALLKGMYFESKLYNSYLHELNAHNQYLSMAIKTGVIGLLIYLSMLFYLCSKAAREKNILLGSFLVICCVVGFSENILDANKGIFFVSFFLSLLVLPVQSRMFIRK